MIDHSPRVAPRPWYPLSLAVLAGIWLAMLLLGTGRFDREVYEAVYAGNSRSLIEVAKLFTLVGEPTIMVVVGVAVAAWLWLRGQRRLGAALLLVFLGGRALAEVQKYAVARVRPGLEPHLVRVETFSFPSGHAANSMIVLLTLALALAPDGRWRVPIVGAAVLLSVLIGFSRVMLGVHWPSDVVGGWSFGLLWVLATLAPAQRLLAVPVRR